MILKLEKWLIATSRSQKTQQPEKKKWINQTVDWVNRQFWKNYSLYELSKNPLTLSFIGALASSRIKQNLPSTIIEIMKIYFNRLFAKWEASPQGREKFLPDIDFYEGKELLLWGLREIAYCIVSDENQKNKTFDSIKKLLTTRSLIAEYEENKF